MVGGNSLGCATCKLRRVKCDERQPICTQCEKSRRFCPGATTPWRYQYGSQQQLRELLRVTESRQTSEQARILPAVHEIQSNLRWHHTRPADFGVLSSSNVHDIKRLLEPNEAFSILSRPSATPAELLAAQWQRVLHFAPNMRLHLKSFGPYVWEIPCRLGHNRALDHAAQCFFLAYCQWDEQPVEEDQAMLHQYGRAVHVLRKTLDDPRVAQTPETMLASLLILHYETLALNSSNTARVVTLSGGVEAILQACGPRRCRSGLSSSILLGHFANTILYCIGRGTPCFLEQAAWRESIRAVSNAVPVELDLWICLAKLARLLKNVREVVDPTTGSIHATPQKEQVATQIHLWYQSILQLSLRICHDLSAPCIYHNIAPVYTGNPEHHFPKSNDESMLENAKEIIRRTTWYHACIIIANTLLARLGARTSVMHDQSQSSAFFIKSAFKFLLHGDSVITSLWWFLVTPIAYCVSPNEDKQYFLQELSERFRSFKFEVKEPMMIANFDRFTGGPLPGL